MLLLKVGSAVINQTPMDWEGNLSRILVVIKEAREKGVGLLCLPELCITGYGCEDQFFSLDLQREAYSSLCKLVHHSHGMAISVGLPIRHRNGLYNCACLIHDGAILGFVAKQHLAGDGLHYEPRWFKEWPAGQIGRVFTPNGADYAIGDLQFDFTGVRVGYEICEDAWVADRPGAELSKKGVDIILNPSASHFAFGKFQTRRRFVTEGSRAFGVTYIYSNLLGNEAGRAIYDGGALIATAGEIVAQGSRFSYSDHELTTAVIDIDKTRTIQTRTASFHPNLQDLPGLIKTHTYLRYALAVDRPEASTTDPWETSTHLKFEEFERAACLGLFDYMRKSHVDGFVVSLSGGADSTACALLVREMIHHARYDISKLWPNADPKLPWLETMNRLLTCVYQGTKNSSETTLNAARAVATQIGARFMNLDVNPMVEQYQKTIEQAIGRSLTWETDDTTLQNIQARVRAPSVWMIANINNALLLSTSNRSEAAVGYCTMDGDTAGSISPIAGIDKNFLRQWLVYKSSPYFDAVCLVTNQEPTAELRPENQHQTDEKDLMPYDILDMIEGAAVRDKKSPVEVFRTLRPAVPGVAKQQLADWVAKFFRLWCRNQWKRERYAPSFHYDDKNLDPRSWCRFPILSSGFDGEIRTLMEYIKGIE